MKRFTYLTIPVLLVAVVAIAAFAPDSLTLVFIGLMFLLILAGIWLGMLPVLRFIDGFAAARKNMERTASEQESRAWLAILKAEDLFGNRVLNRRYADYRKKVEHQRANGETIADITDYLGEDITDLLAWKNVVSQFSSVLTAIGLLGTFIGLLLGLHQIEFGTADKALSSIREVLSDINVAFYTSIAGLILSVLFNLENRLLYNILYREIGLFTDAFHKYAIPDTHEQERYRTRKDQKEMIHLLKTIAQNTASDRGLPGMGNAALSSETAKALRDGAFGFEAEPVYDLLSRTVAFFRIRPVWHHPVMGDLHVDTWEPALRESGYITRIHDTIWKKVSRTLRSKTESGKHPVPAVVPVSAMDITTGHAEDLIRMIRDMELPPQTMLVSIGEETYQTVPDAARETEKQLLDAGIRVVITGFDGQFAALAGLKVSADFVCLPVNGMSRGTLTGIIRTADTQNISVIAECLDDPEAVSLAKYAGCRYGTGRALAEPVTDAEFAQTEGIETDEENT